MIVRCVRPFCFFFFFNDTATTEIYTLSLHDALPISLQVRCIWIWFTCLRLRLFNAFLSPLSLVDARAFVVSAVHCICEEVIHICEQKSHNKAESRWINQWKARLDTLDLRSNVSTSQSWLGMAKIWPSMTKIWPGMTQLWTGMTQLWSGMNQYEYLGLRNIFYMMMMS